MKYLNLIATIAICWASTATAETIYDKSRDRKIPIEITFPKNPEKCSTKSKCPVVLLSAGYGISHLEYTFISEPLSQQGYLVVAIGHELPNDPELSVSGNLYETRSENWSRGALTLDFVKNLLSRRLNVYEFEQLILIGHSNGGDISAWLGNEEKAYIKGIITLDHRRVPLPRKKNVQILSIRASDFPADENVLPTESEQKKYGSCIVTIPKAKHNDIVDFGPVWLKEKIAFLISNHLKGLSCSEVKNF